MPQKTTMDKQKQTGLIFIHGWATDSWVWRYQVKALKNGRIVLNLNLPGHGGKICWNEPTLLPPIQEILTRFPFLESDKSNVGGIIGIGWSLGAQVLLTAAIENIKKFKGLILVGATPCFVKEKDFPWGQPRAIVKKMISDMQGNPINTVKRFYRLNFTHNELKTENSRSFIKKYERTAPNFKIDEISTALETLYKTDLRNRLHALNIPTLIVHGEMDNVCPVGAARYLANEIKGADLVIFKKAGHAPFFTENERFNKLLQHFISRL